MSKKEVFEEGFVADKSGHSRGSTIDLTLVHKINGTDVDFGTSFDFFGEKAHTDFDNITDYQKNNRQYLKRVMEDNGFINIPEEWWHFTLANEPFPNIYFNFPVNATLIRQGN